MSGSRGGWVPADSGAPAAPGVPGAEASLGRVPLLEPLAYPGRMVTEPVLLDSGALVRVGDAADFDVLLRGCGAAPLGRRVAVLGVGSNGAAAQVRHKFARAGVSGVVPMAPVRVEGLGIGVSGHISRAGYVAAAPYVRGGGAGAGFASAVVSWLDAEQLAVMDASEFPQYVRALLPADTFPVDGAPANAGAGAGVHLYVSARGVLSGTAAGEGEGTAADGGGAGACAGGRTPLVADTQPGVLRGLLARSAALRALFGETPESWVRLAGGDAGLRERGTAVFAEEGWVLSGVGRRAFDPYVVAR